MNNGWRLYLYLCIIWEKSPSVLSPSLLSPPRFPALSSLQVANKLPKLTRASGRFLSSVLRTSLHQPAQPLGNTPLSSLGFHNTALTWFWSSLAFFWSSSFQCAAQVPLLTSKCFLSIPEGSVWDPPFLFCTLFLGDVLQTCASRCISSAWWWLPNLFSPANN